jgi:pyridoxine 5-phosphate synthase
MAKLSVNVNKVATLRNTRSIGIPSVLHAAKLCLDAGAHGITVHPRPDQRHIRPHDVYEIAELLKRYPHTEFNIEGNPFHEFMHFAREVRPTQCTLVPDSPEASTSDHGWDLRRERVRLLPIVKQLHEYGCRVSVFMDPQPQAMALAAELGVDRVELYTAPYAEAFAAGDADAGEAYAGHDLNLENLPPLIRKIPFIAEVSIGHALIGDSLEFGLPLTVQKYLSAAAVSDIRSA